jgi:hypothetical protein
MRKIGTVPIFLLFAAASLFHHVHNAELLDQYPNMPAGLTRAGVYAAWLIATAVGILGFWLRRRVLLALYAGYGLAVLVHYAIAPISAHTPMMHFTISLEAATAAALLVVTFRRGQPSP